MVIKHPIFGNIRTMWKESSENLKQSFLQPYHSSHSSAMRFLQRNNALKACFESTCRKEWNDATLEELQTKASALCENSGDFGGDIEICLREILSAALNNSNNTDVSF